MKSPQLNKLQEALVEVGSVFKQFLLLVKDGLQKLQTKQRVPSASTMVRGKLNPLRLDLQFFADPAGDPPGDDDPTDPPADPPSGDDTLTLADLLRTNPAIKTEYNERVEKVVKKRLKNFDFDPDEARTALREKKERDAAGDSQQTVVNQEITDLKTQNQKLLDRTKALNLANYASSVDLDPKLLVRLAGSSVSELELNEQFELDTDELDDIVADLRTEFPNLFPQPGAAGEDPEDPPPAARKTTYNAGSQQRTNTPPKTTGDANAATEVADTLERLKKMNRI